METVQSIPNAAISFPMLGEGFAFTGSATYTLFGFTLHWYGLIIALGFILAYLYANRRCRDFGLTQDHIIDMLLFAVPAAVVGARLYYVIFNFALIKDNFWNIFKVWEGGLAIYGAVIGAVLAVAIYCRVKKIPIGPFLDIGGLGLLIGQIIGRWANFINREAFGAETEIFCRMGLTDASGNTIYVHPTFLYESLWNLVGLLILHLFSKAGKRRYDGQLFAMYVVWYGFGRMLIEGLRTDSLYFFDTGLRVSQLLAGASCLAALVYLAVNGSRPHSRERLFVNLMAAKDAEAEAAEEAKSDEAK